jgi:hypothetical protein
MIDSARGVFRMKDIPMTGFIGTNNALGCNELFYKGHTVRFGPGDGCESASLPFAGNDNDPALACLMFGAEAVNPVRSESGGADVSAE